MDRNAPAPLTDTAQSGYDDSEALIKKWHGQGRNLYAITPRFAPSSTEAQLQAAGALWQAYPETWTQTHVSEDRKEIEWLKELFPDRVLYLAMPSTWTNSDQPIRVGLATNGGGTSLSMLQTLGDDRATQAVYIAGELAYTAPGLSDDAESAGRRVMNLAT